MNGRFILDHLRGAEAKERGLNHLSDTPMATALANEVGFNTEASPFFLLEAA